MLMPKEDQDRLTWTRATRSQGFGMCVELAAHPNGVAVRHASTPEDGALVYTQREFAAFVDGVMRGEFDHLFSED